MGISMEYPWLMEICVFLFFSLFFLFSSTTYGISMGISMEYLGISVFVLPDFGLNEEQLWKNRTMNCSDGQEKMYYGQTLLVS